MTANLDELAIDVVVIERIPMPLIRRADRAEAVRRLSAKGLQSGQIADLLCCTSTLVRRIQRANGIEPAAPDYTIPRSPDALARAARRQRAYRAARKT